MKIYNKKCNLSKILKMGHFRLEINKQNTEKLIIKINYKHTLHLELIIYNNLHI